MLDSFLQSGVGKFLSSGAMVNFFLIAIGSFVGILLKKGFNEKIKQALMTAVALCVSYIGITGLFEKQADIMIIIISFLVGGILGEVIDLDKWINVLGKKIEKNFGGEKSSVANGFVTASILFCVGAMAIVGSIKSGIEGDNSILYSKSVIDGVTSVALASTLGIGVILSALPVLVLEGAMTLLAAFVAPYLTDFIVAQISVIGSILIFAIGLNMLGITKIKIINFVPAVLLPLVFLIF